MPMLTTRQRDLVITASALLGATVALILMLRHHDELGKAAMLVSSYIMLVAIWLAPRSRSKRPRKARTLLVVVICLGGLAAGVVAARLHETRSLFMLWLIGGLIVAVGQIVWRAVRSHRTS